MSNSKKEILEFLEKNQLDDFKKAINENIKVSTDDVCLWFNVCMLEIDTKKAFAKCLWEKFNNLLTSKSSSLLLNSFSLYWNNSAKSFYEEIKTKKISVPEAVPTTNSCYSYDVNFLKTIKQVRSNLYNMFKFQINAFTEAERKIIIDVFTFLTFKCANSDHVLDFYKNDFLDIARSMNFNENLSSVSKNFKNILEHLIVNLHLENRVSVNYLNELLSDSKLQNYTDANVALNIYLIKGKFNWVPLGHSSFGYYVNNSSSLDFSNSEPPINCWESILYGLYKSNIISLDDLKKAYASDVNIADSVGSWFGYKKAQSINLFNWREILSDSSKLLLGDSHDTGNGLSHVMVSVPFSEKQILKMLITKDFNEKPCNLKLYSHWNRYTDKKLGSIPKKDFDKLVSNDLNFRARSISETFNRQ